MRSRSVPKILIAEADPTLAAHLGRVLAEQGYEPVVAETGREALELAQRISPDTAIVDEALPDMLGTDLCTRLRQNQSTFPIPVLILTRSSDAASKIAVIEAGADDHLTRPFHPDALIYRVKSILVRAQTPYGALLGGRQRGRIIAVFGAKGGVGATTLSVNLALALHKRGGGKVMLFDTVFAFGDTGVHLDVNAPYNMLDLGKRVEDLEPALLDQVLARHASGIRLLVGPSYPEDGEAISASDVERVLKYLAELYDYVIVDCPTSYDDRTITVLEHAHEIVLVTTPEISGIKNASTFINLAERLRLPLSKIRVVLNRANSNAQIGSKEIERILQHDITYRLPSSGRAMMRSVTQGRPLVLHEAHHHYSQTVLEMADNLLGRSTAPRASSRSPLLLTKLADRGKLPVAGQPRLATANVANQPSPPPPQASAATGSLFGKLWNRMRGNGG